MTLNGLKAGLYAVTFTGDGKFAVSRLVGITREMAIAGAEDNVEVVEIVSDHRSEMWALSGTCAEDLRLYPLGYH